ncbi:MAG: YihY/virulence factor BrkB family protein [Anaerolineales bacterium]|nr:YihY/virulence factor BrkB family protein [Anaerolineales bacterium]
MNRLPGDILSVLRFTLDGFVHARAAQAAASVAYYALFSIFPILLVLITVGSFFLEIEQVHQEVVRVVSRTLPVSQGLIVENLQQVIDNRGSVGLLGLLALLWSASSVFTSLVHNVNLAWPDAARRNFLQKRLVGIGMIGVLTILLLLSLGVDLFTSRFSWMRGGWGLEVFVEQSFFWEVVSLLSPWALMFLFFSGLYRWVPSSQVTWRAALWSAFSAATIWTIAVRLFSWYGNDVTRFSTVYGSLSALVALMLLVYLFCLITLLGAHLASAVDRHRGHPSDRPGRSTAASLTI